jgi:hypothetical protein
MASAGGGAGGGALVIPDYMIGFCNICFMPYEETGNHVPLQALCGHTFCKFCFSNLMQPKKCPTCRSHIGDSFPKNRALIEVLASFQFINRSNPRLEDMTDEQVEEYLIQRRARITQEQEACKAACEAATYSVRISGATGNNSKYINGIYEVTGEIFGGMPVYKNKEQEQWLEYHVSSSKWLSRSAEGKGQENNKCTAYVSCEIGVLPDKVQNKIWRVVIKKKLSPQLSVIATQSSDEVVENVDRRIAIYPLLIFGVKGDHAYLSGDYYIADEISGGMPVYKKHGGEIELWLEYNILEHCWMLRKTEHKGQACKLCHGYVDCPPGILPDKAPKKKWIIITNDDWASQESVDVKPL